MGFYHGTAGIGLTLAQAGRICGRAEWLTLGRDAFLPLRRLAADPEAGRPSGAAPGIGYADGLGGMIAALVWVARLLAEPACLRDARILAEWAVAPAGGTAADLHDGAAGLLIGLCSLHHQQTSCDDDLVAIIAAWADHLVGLGRDEAGALVWPSGRVPVLGGLAHGQAGIAVALAAAGRATGRDDYLQAAEHALVAEDRLFDPAAANWPAPGGQRRPTTAWCHGAAGIALSRMALLTIAPDRFGPARPIWSWPSPPPPSPRRAAAAICAAEMPGGRPPSRWPAARRRRVGPMRPHSG
ncbi:lanthionine synthetase LanC family protein [Tistrella bauzanensis]